MIRTVLTDERTSKVRGSRLWAAAELSSTTWFVTETSVEVSGEYEVQQWVTHSISQAVLIQRSLEPYIWSRIFVCMRAPTSIQNGTLFEVVREAYQSGSRDSYFLLLDNGMSFSTGTETPQQIDDVPEKLNLIYAKDRH